LVLKNESYFDKVTNDGSYYIRTNQLAEKALVLFKDMKLLVVSKTIE
jgi:hypothetical protein